MKNKTIILQASSRSKGDSHTIINYLNTDHQFDVIDLKTKNIGHFDYEFKNVDDDFIALMAEITEKYDTLAFVTPVYWYSMSGILKVFFDRFSDLLKTHKELGRKLRDKQMAMISCSNSNDLKEGFTMPFIESANYLGMHYIRDIHTWVVDGMIPEEVKKAWMCLKKLFLDFLIKKCELRSCLLLGWYQSISFIKTEGYLNVIGNRPNGK